MAAASVVAPFPPVTVGGRDEEGYPVNSHGVRIDYNDIKSGGETDILANQAETQVPFGDWRDEFFRNGYYVVKGAIPRERAEQYRLKSLDWLSKFSFGFDINDKSTWVQKHLPMMMKGGMIQHYCAAHEKWVWDARW